MVARVDSDDVSAQSSRLSTDGPTAGPAEQRPTLGTLRIEPVDVAALEPGMVFDRPLVNALGDVLWREDQELHAEICEWLKSGEVPVFTPKDPGAWVKPVATNAADSKPDNQATQGKTLEKPDAAPTFDPGVLRAGIRKAAHDTVHQQRERWSRMPTRVEPIGTQGGPSVRTSRAVLGPDERDARTRAWERAIGNLLDKGFASPAMLTDLAFELVDLSRRAPAGLLYDALSRDVYEDGSSQQLAGHALRVAMLAGLAACRMGWSDADVQGVVLSGLLADAGMLLLPTPLRSHARPLSDEELNQLHRHPAYSAMIVRLLSKTGEIPESVQIAVSQHHEREDARGYPDNRPGRDTHDYAKLVGVCDVMVGMISPRAHKPGIDPAAAIRDIVHFAAEGRLNGRMARALVDVCGIYPPGSRVRLSTGHAGEVVVRGPSDGSRPIVRVLATRGADRTGSIDLSRWHVQQVRVLGPLAA